jgi:hypothetical protein
MTLKNTIRKWLGVESAIQNNNSENGLFLKKLPIDCVYNFQIFFDLSLNTYYMKFDISEYGIKLDCPIITGSETWGFVRDKKQNIISLKVGTSLKSRHSIQLIELYIIDQLSLDVMDTIKKILKTNIETNKNDTTSKS